ncbi:MAG: hypothetical protein ABFC94_19130 [Syntrophomonas sp.]
MRAMVKADKDSSDPDKIPEEECDIHTSFNISGMFKNRVMVCRDPRHEGELYEANIPNATQSGGCPQEYLEEMVLEPGQHLSKCSLDDHRVKSKKVRDIINELR